jgi:L-seryl-tRNA(Ser) seleniumtransferase
MSLYDSLGVKRYINANATLTMYGGSIMPQRVLDAMNDAARSFVDIDELHKKAGARIAQMTRNEGAFICNGAASGLLLATALAVAGSDGDARKKLPFSDGMKNEIILSQAGRVGYDYSIKMAGGKIVPYGDDKNGTAEQLEAAITEKTCAIFVFYFENRMGNQPSFEEQVRIAKKHGLYLFVDAAAQLPKKENLWRYTSGGADLAIFSGGKGLRGPQSSGLMVGRKELIDQIRMIASPNGGIGRPMKVGKEEIAGLMTAVELYIAQDEDEQLADYERQVQAVIDAFRGDAAVRVARAFPSEAGQPMPRAQVDLVPDKMTCDASQIAEQLKAGEPGVLVAEQGGSLLINPQPLLEGEMNIVIERLKAVLDANRM